MFVRACAEATEFSATISEYLHRSNGAIDATMAILALLYVDQAERDRVVLKAVMRKSLYG